MSTAKAKSASTTTTTTAVVSSAEGGVAVGAATVPVLPSAGTDNTVSATPDAALRSCEDALALGRDNLDAMVRAGTILGHGLQDLGRMMLGLAQDAVEDSVAAAKRMMAARTITEVIDLQADFARAGLTRMIEDGARLSDLSLRLGERAAAPIAERVNATVDRLVAAA